MNCDLSEDTNVTFEDDALDDEEFDLDDNVKLDDKQTRNFKTENFKPENFKSENRNTAEIVKTKDNFEEFELDNNIKLEDNVKIENIDTEENVKTKENIKTKDNLKRTDMNIWNELCDYSEDGREGELKQKFGANLGNLSEKNGKFVENEIVSKFDNKNTNSDISEKDIGHSASYSKKGNYVKMSFGKDSRFKVDGNKTTVISDLHIDSLDSLETHELVIDEDQNNFEFETNAATKHMDTFQKQFQTKRHGLCSTSSQERSEHSPGKASFKTKLNSNSASSVRSFRHFADFIETESESDANANDTNNSNDVLGHNSSGTSESSNYLDMSSIWDNFKPMSDTDSPNKLHLDHSVVRNNEAYKKPMSSSNRPEYVKGNNVKNVRHVQGKNVKVHIANGIVKNDQISDIIRSGNVVFNAHIDSSITDKGHAIEHVEPITVFKQEIGLETNLQAFDVSFKGSSVGAIDNARSESSDLDLPDFVDSLLNGEMVDTARVDDREFGAYRNTEQNDSRNKRANRVVNNWGGEHIDGSTEQCSAKLNLKNKGSVMSNNAANGKLKSNTEKAFESATKSYSNQETPPSVKHRINTLEKTKRESTEPEKSNNVDVRKECNRASDKCMVSRKEHTVENIATRNIITDSIILVDQPCKGWIDCLDKPEIESDIKCAEGPPKSVSGCNKVVPKGRVVNRTNSMTMSDSNGLNVSLIRRNVMGKTDFETVKHAYMDIRTKQPLMLQRSFSTPAAGNTFEPSSGCSNSTPSSLISIPNGNVSTMATHIVNQTVKGKSANVSDRKPTKKEQKSNKSEKSKKRNDTLVESHKGQNSKKRIDKVRVSREIIDEGFVNTDKMISHLNEKFEDIKKCMNFGFNSQTFHNGSSLDRKNESTLQAKHSGKDIFQSNDFIRIAYTNGSVKGSSLPPTSLKQTSKPGTISDSMFSVDTEEAKPGNGINMGEHAPEMTDDSDKRNVNSIVINALSQLSPLGQNKAKSKGKKSNKRAYAVTDPSKKEDINKVEQKADVYDFSFDDDNDKSSIEHLHKSVLKKRKISLKGDKVKDDYDLTKDLPKLTKDISYQNNQILSKVSTENKLESLESPDEPQFNEGHFNETFEETDKGYDDESEIDFVDRLLMGENSGKELSLNRNKSNRDLLNMDASNQTSLRNNSTPTDKEKDMNRFLNDCVRNVEINNLAARNEPQNALNVKPEVRQLHRIPASLSNIPETSEMVNFIGTVEREMNSKPDGSDSKKRLGSTDAHCNGTTEEQVNKKAKLSVQIEHAVGNLNNLRHKMPEKSNNHHIKINVANGSAELEVSAYLKPLNERNEVKFAFGKTRKAKTVSPNQSKTCIKKQTKTVHACDNSKMQEHDAVAKNVEVNDTPRNEGVHPETVKVNSDSKDIEAHSLADDFFINFEDNSIDQVASTTKSVERKLHTATLRPFNKSEEVSSVNLRDVQKPENSKIGPSENEKVSKVRNDFEEFDDSSDPDFVWNFEPTVYKMFKNSASDQNFEPSISTVTQIENTNLELVPGEDMASGEETPKPNLISENKGQETTPFVNSEMNEIESDADSMFDVVLHARPAVKVGPEKVRVNADDETAMDKEKLFKTKIKDTVAFDRNCTTTEVEPKIEHLEIDEPDFDEVPNNIADHNWNETLKSFIMKNLDIEDDYCEGKIEKIEDSLNVESLLEQKIAEQYLHQNIEKFRQQHNGLVWDTNASTTKALEDKLTHGDQVPDHNEDGLNADMLIKPDELEKHFEHFGNVVSDLDLDFHTPISAPVSSAIGEKEEENVQM